MKEQLLSLVAVLLASCVVMILHELPKIVIHHKNKNIFSYIDPVGLIFCVTSYCGFSKPYIYLGKEKEISRRSGIVGLCSLFFIFIGSILLAKYGLKPLTNRMNLETLEGTILVFCYFFIQSIAIISFGMFVTNLFPLAVLDMGQIIRGKSDHMYFSILKSDSIIKMIYFVVVLLGLIKSFGVQTVMYLLGS